MDRAKLLEVEERIRVCTKCNLCKSRTMAVPGEGSNESGILFIGEAPGANEDKKGIPFCGAAGKFFDELLKSINLDRNKVYVTNTVKCRPPGIRDPLPEEIASCKPWLDMQIEILNPEIICVLGRHSMERFLPGMKISSIHGKVFL